ncbi:MAG: HD-GYP domain-containing protein [Deltaproteobacteria bacterium]|nr:HD-GYP domain-containing protein [Deltaproteobacteria bacterium]
MIVKIEVDFLRMGMYVAQLDRPYFQTPFFSHKFLIKTQKQIDQLQKYCAFVYIDTEKGINGKPSREDPNAQAVKNVPQNNGNGRKEREETGPPTGEELRRALEVHHKAKEVVKNIINDIRLGQSIKTDEAKELVEAIITSLMEDKNALLCLSGLNTRDEYTAVHSINVCILAVAFGRELKLVLGDLQKLGLGGLLHDVGKIKIPLEILNKPGRLTDSEFEIMKNHVLLGQDLLEKQGGFPSESIDVVLQHHERFNGEGYPFGLKSSQITLFGGIAAIVDVYDAITSDRIYRSSMPPHEAIKKLYEWSSALFDRPLVEHFIKTIGIYPVGSQVEINHSDIGVVVSNRHEDVLRPCVLLVLDNQNQKYRPPRLIDLAEKDPYYNRHLWSVTKIFNSVQKELLSPFYNTAG